MPVNEEGSLQLSDTDYLETWRGMEECARLGLARSIGISNFNPEQITRLLGVAKALPVNNQVIILNIIQFLDSLLSTVLSSNYFHSG